MEKEQDDKLPFLDVLVTRTHQGFRSSVYHNPPFTGQYLNFNSHHPYCLQHGANAISSDTYQEEMISLRHNLHLNKYPERIILSQKFGQLINKIFFKRSKNKTK